MNRRNNRHNRKHRKRRNNNVRSTRRNKQITNTSGETNVKGELSIINNDLISEKHSIQVLNEDVNKKEMNLVSAKASFVAGIMAILVAFCNVLKLWEITPRWMDGILLIICLTLFFIVLGTNRLDSVLDKPGVEKFGMLLTVYSIISFMIERLEMIDSSTEPLELSLLIVLNSKLFYFIIYLAIALFGIFAYCSFILKPSKKLK